MRINLVHHRNLMTFLWCVTLVYTNSINPNGVQFVPLYSEQAKQSIAKALTDREAATIVEAHGPFNIACLLAKRVIPCVREAIVGSVR
jgi:hypothetical protein